MTLTSEEKLQEYQKFNSGIMNYESVSREAPEGVSVPNIDVTTPELGENEYVAVPKKSSNATPPMLKEDYLNNDSFNDIKELENVNTLLKPVKKKSFDSMTGNYRKALDFEPFEKEIRMKESDGIATAKNPKSSAVGFYQFLWGSWGNDIKKVTGVKDVKDYMSNPDAQKQYFKYYFDKHIIPGVDSIKTTVGAGGLSDYDLGQLIHFRGLGGAKKLIKSGELNKKQEDYNPTALDYIKRK